VVFLLPPGGDGSLCSRPFARGIFVSFFSCPGSECGFLKHPSPRSEIHPERLPRGSSQAPLPTFIFKARFPCPGRRPTAYVRVASRFAKFLMAAHSYRDLSPFLPRPPNSDSNDWVGIRSGRMFFLSAGDSRRGPFPHRPLHCSAPNWHIADLPLGARNVYSCAVFVSPN